MINASVIWVISDQFFMGGSYDKVFQIKNFVNIKFAGLPKELSIHSARHTIAVHLLKKAGNLRQVQKQLGHASPATTANMYADISFEDMQNGVTGLYEN